MATLPKIFWRLLGTSAFSLLLTAAASAQPGGGGPIPGGPTPVPIDGGASLLLASGVALGLRKLRRKRQQQ